MDLQLYQPTSNIDLINSGISINIGQKKESLYLDGQIQRKDPSI